MLDLSRFTEYKKNVLDNCSQVIVGKEDVITLVLTCFICSGHVLLEDVPGTGKTMLLRAFAKTVGGDFKRIQFTPDLLAGLSQTVTAEETAYVRLAYREVKVSDEVKGYLMDIIEGTREESSFVNGVSTRGALALYQASQAYAALGGRTYVLPEDVKYLAPFVLSHRLGAGSRSGAKSGDFLKRILERTRVPLEEIP